MTKACWDNIISSPAEERAKFGTPSLKIDMTIPTLLNLGLGAPGEL